MISPRPCLYLDLGLMAFTRTHNLQLDILEARISEHIQRDVVLFLEHPAVFTVGRRGGFNNLRVTPSFLSDSGIHLHHIERGGDITFHGPGQLVVYPVMYLKATGFGVLGFVERLEEAMIRTAADWGITATRDPRNRGVWVDNKKIGSIGIAVRRGIVFHGMALNVDLSLRPFSWINPCGLEGIDMTTMNREGKKPAAVSEVKAVLKKHFEDIFSLTFHDITINDLKIKMKPI